MCRWLGSAIVWSMASSSSGLIRFPPIVNACGRSLAGDFLDISDTDSALLINGVPEPLFAPARFREDFCALRIENKNVGSSSYAVAFDVVRDGRDVVLDGGRSKAAGYNLAVGA